MEIDKVREMLNQDLETLMKQRKNAIESQISNDSKAFKSGLSALEITRLIKDTLELLSKLPNRNEIEWRSLNSCYGMMKPEFKHISDDEINPQEHFMDVISLWEQNSNGEIRNHRIFKRGEQIL